MMGAMEGAADPVPSSPVASGPIVRTNVIGTALFVVSATLSAIVFTAPLRLAAVVVALALFATGIFSFLWSYWTAVQRSRIDNIAVAQLYFLAGGSTPRQVRRTMNGQEFEATLGGTNWEITKPAKIPADQPGLEELADRLSTLRAERVADVEGKDLAKYGLVTPAAATVCVTPAIRSQASTVQGFPSSSAGGAVAAHTPSAVHDSVPLQTLPSEQLEPVATS